MITMKATLDIPETLYRQVKAKSALEGVTVREVAIHLFTRWTGSAESMAFPEKKAPFSTPPAWFGGARQYASTVDSHDMDDIRNSISAGRTREGIG
jgi:hypothetical protein